MTNNSHLTWLYELNQSAEFHNALEGLAVIPLKVSILLTKFIERLRGISSITNVGNINKYRNRPSDFITSRAKGSVSRNNQLEGISTEQRLNSLIRKGTSKERALWAIHNMWPPGIWWLLTNWSKIGINSFILHVNKIFIRKQLLSIAENTIKCRKTD